MCQYKAKDGIISDWHLQHYSRFAFSGLGAAFIEATGVSPEGRIGHGCTGIWSDDHIEGLSKIVKTFNEYDCLSGVQLAHAGVIHGCAIVLPKQVAMLNYDKIITEINIK
jgi:2,4-dienoyl-CoA reductase-like NADH-dependent reductase (Old Yellow Enzyme family)